MKRGDLIKLKNGKTVAFDSFGFGDTVYVYDPDGSGAIGWSISKDSIENKNKGNCCVSN